MEYLGGLENHTQTRFPTHIKPFELLHSTVDVTSRPGGELQLAKRWPVTPAMNDLI